MGFLASIAFTAFGKQISWKMIGYAILAVIIAVILWFAYSKVHDHFKHISDLEDQVVELQDTNFKTQKELDQAVEINRQNAATTAAELAALQSATDIANTEAASSTVRTTKKKEVQDAIDRAPPSAAPVAPVVTDTLNRLWE